MQSRKSVEFYDICQADISVLIDQHVRICEL